MRDPFQSGTAIEKQLKGIERHGTASIVTTEGSVKWQHLDGDELQPSDALESYFKKYPDVPKETILKQHLLSLGHWFSDAALDATAGALVKSYRLFSYDLVPMSELKRSEHRRVPEHFVLLTGPTTCAR